MEAYIVLPSVKDGLNCYDKKEEHAESQIGRIGAWISQRFVTNDTDDSRDEQKTSESTEEVTKANHQTLFSWVDSTFCEHDGWVEGIAHFFHWLEAVVELDYCRDPDFDDIPGVAMPPPRIFCATLILQCL